MGSIILGVTIYGLFMFVVGLWFGYKCGKGEKLW